MKIPVRPGLPTQIKPGTHPQQLHTPVLPPETGEASPPSASRPSSKAGAELGRQVVSKLSQVEGGRGGRRTSHHLPWGKKLKRKQHLPSRFLLPPRCPTAGDSHGSQKGVRQSTCSSCRGHGHCLPMARGRRCAQRQARCRGGGNRRLLGCCTPCSCTFRSTLSLPWTSCSSLLLRPPQDHQAFR